jgi:hypothetical protein
MVSLDWLSLNDTLKITHTKKKFFNEFLYRVTYQVPGASMLSWKYSPGESISDRIGAYNARITGDPIHLWYSHHKLPANINQLNDFNCVYNTKSNTLKFRIERDNLSMYSNSDTQLYQIAAWDLIKWTNDLTSVSLVKSESTRQLLDMGYAIVRDDTYPYRVRLREGSSNIADRKSLTNYLITLGTDVKITKLMLTRLDSSHKYFHGGYLYVNDIRIVDILRIISPAIIGSVTQLVINN